MSPLIGEQTDLHFSPESVTLERGATFYLSLEVTSGQPVNVFSGEVHFDDTLLTVESISYNTSIADLWAEKPWYDEGAGVVHFAGGTTDPGGFIGTGELLTITFRGVATGESAIALTDARVLRYDGLGTDVDLPAPIDSLIMIEDQDLGDQVKLQKEREERSVQVVEQLDLDVNDDGRVSFADVSGFMFDLGTQARRSDFNGDGRVSATDLSILLNAL